MNLKEYVAISLQGCKNEIAEHRSMLSKTEELDSSIDICKITKEINEFINYKQSLVYAWESLLKEL